MNPLLFKAHWLQYLTVDLLLQPGAHRFWDIIRVLLIYGSLNLFSTGCLIWSVRQLAGVRLAAIRSFVLALPATVFYAPLMLTVLNDILNHQFRWQDRYILVFMIVVASQMLGAGYGLLIRYPHGNRPIGLQSGFGVSLLLLLASIPVGLVFLWFDGGIRIR